MHLRRLIPLATLCTLLSAHALAAPTDTHFTYQGRLKKTSLPVNASADFTFSLWDSSAGGTQIGLTQSINNITLTDGLLTADLDFGPAAFNGDGRWLQIAVRTPAGSGVFTPLSPRDPILPTPYALFALNGTPGASLPSGLMVLSTSQSPPAGFSFTGYQIGATNPWVVKASTLASGNSLNFCTSLNGKLYHVPSAQTAFSSFDPATGAWTSLAVVPASINSGSLVGASGKVILTNPTFGPIYLYDPAANAWTTGASMLANRITSACELNSLVYACGGFAGGNYSAIVESYDPAANAWTTRAPLPAQRLSGSVTGIAGKLYYAGGTDNTGTIISTVYAYDPAANSWSTRASLIARSGQGAAEISGKLYIFGGASAAGVAADTTDVYDPITDTWTRLVPRLNTPRLGPGGAAALGKLYCVGGTIPPSNTPSAATEELLAPPAAFYVMIKN